MTESALHKPWLRYWRNSLADAENRSGSMFLEEFQRLALVHPEVFLTGCLQPQLSETSQTLAQLFLDRPASVKLVRVMFHPYVYKPLIEHGVQRDELPEVVLPVRCEVWVGRDGRFVPAAPATIPRDLLSPQPDHAFSIAKVPQLDAFLTQHAFECYTENQALSVLSPSAQPQWKEAWAKYRALTEQLFNTLCDVKALSILERFEKASLMPVDRQCLGATRHIIPLYDWLAHVTEPLPLLDAYAKRCMTNHQPLVDPLESMAVRLGHANSKYSLTVAQRDALTQSLLMQEGEILAVNGPPGTGKTTFVLSVVASLWIKAALEETEPPLIVATSSNNQAVTNILAAFAAGFEVTDNPVSQRWLPNIEGYGGFYPAPSKEEKYRHHQTPAFYRDMEKRTAFEEAEREFLSRAQTAFGDDTLTKVEWVKQRLLAKLQEAHSHLETLQASWKTFQQEQQAWLSITQGQNLEDLVSDLQQDLHDLKTCYASMTEDAKRWRKFLADEPLWWPILQLIPTFKRKRRLKMWSFIETNLSPEAQALFALGDHAQFDHDERVIQACLTQQKAIIQAQENKLQGILQLTEHHQTTKADCLNRWSQALGQPQQVLPESFDEFDQRLDTSLRFQLFQWAMHYWEARWLEDCHAQRKELKEQERTQKEKPGRGALQPRWRRRMKLTPCVVSTLHALPFYMKHREFESKNRFRDAYLTQEIDLLIIDEAGQVAPDVAGASVALAKRVLAIGDIQQIPPVVTLEPSVDAGNLLQQGLLTASQGYEQLQQTGRTVVGGSVMRIAQQSSHYHHLPQAETGMFLREHHRCLNEIISFCNELCYQGVLKPQRQQPAQDPVLPPFAYVHVDGCAESTATGSRINRLEAITIAEWLLQEKDRIEHAHSGQKLEHIVGLITPFKAQASLIRRECQERGLFLEQGEDAMSIGTVHALQGAERPVVIFSAVYSRHQNGGFIDKTPSILNVAVSRAKDSFIVFGDMDVLSSANPGTPRHLLAQYLLANDSNQLMFVASQARPDLLQYCREPKIIHDAKQHDECFRTCLQTAKKRVSIVSPWVTLSQLRDTGLLQEIQHAVKRGVEVELYVDQHFNQKDQAASLKFMHSCNELIREHIKVYVLSRVHSKILMVDDTLLCVGSFNWASAVRDQSSRYYNMETSIVYQGNLASEINSVLSRLHAKRMDVFEKTYREAS